MGSWFYNIVEVMTFMIYNEELCIAFLVFIVISGNHPTKSSIRLFMGNHQNSKLPHFILPCIYHVRYSSWVWVVPSSKEKLVLMVE